MCELTAAEERFAPLYDAITCGVLVRDGAGAIVHANYAAERVFGAGAAQMRGHGGSALRNLQDPQLLHTVTSALNAWHVAPRTLAAAVSTLSLLP